MKNVTCMGAGLVCAMWLMLACESAEQNQPPEPDTSPDVSPETFPDGSPDTSGPSWPDFPAEGLSQTVGPDGGTLAAAGVELVIPEGALDEPVTITVRPSAREIPDATLYGPVLDLGPPGLVFSKPAAIRFTLPEGRTEAAIMLTLAHDPDDFQSLDVLVVDGVAQALVPHFSTIYIADPDNPGSLMLVCCLPLDPLATPAGDCVIIDNGLSCDTSICSVTPGVCQPSTSTGGCPPCVPKDAGTPQSACLFNPGNGAVCDPDLCAPNPACDPSTPPAACDHCADPRFTDLPDYQTRWAQAYAEWAPMSCGSMSGQGVLPRVPESDPNYWAHLLRFCTHQQAMADKHCGDVAANMCGLDTTNDPCAPCADQTFWNNPEFVESFTTVHATYLASDCDTLGAYPIVYPQSIPPFWGEVHRFCSLEQAKNDLGCTGDAASVCQLPPLVSPCERCTDTAYWDNPDFVTNYEASFSGYIQDSCENLGTYPVNPPVGPEPFWGLVSRFCSHAQAIADLDCDPAVAAPICDLTPSAGGGCDAQEVTCLDGSCVAAADECPGGATDTPEGCTAAGGIWCDESGACVSDWGSCLCGGGGIRCGDGSCVAPGTACPCGDGLLTCHDGTCVVSLDRCPPTAEEACLAGGDIWCADSEACVSDWASCLCGGGGTRCDDGSCVAPGQTCPCAGGQFRCPTGQCVASADRCPQSPEDACAAAGRFWCTASNSCVQEPTLCPCGGGGNRCHDGSCVEPGTPCPPDCRVPCQPILPTTPAEHCAQNPTNDVVCDPDLCEPRAECSHALGCCAFVTPAAGSGCSEPAAEAWCDAQDLVDGEPPRFYPGLTCQYVRQNLGENRCGP